MNTRVSVCWRVCVSLGGSVSECVSLLLDVFHFLLVFCVLTQSKLIDSGCYSDDITWVTHILIDRFFSLCISFKVTLTCHTATGECWEAGFFRGHLTGPSTVISLAPGEEGREQSPRLVLPRGRGVS